jgi:hypothetical protein
VGGGEGSARRVANCSSNDLSGEVVVEDENEEEVKEELVDETDEDS